MTCKNCKKSTFIIKENITKYSTYDNGKVNHSNQYKVNNVKYICTNCGKEYKEDEL